MFLEDETIETGTSYDGRPEYRLTRLATDELKIEFVWWGTPNHQRSDKTCTLHEALELRDALTELYPPEDDFLYGEEEAPRFTLHFAEGNDKWEVWEDGVLRGEFFAEDDAEDFLLHLEWGDDALDTILVEDDLSWLDEDANHDVDADDNPENSESPPPKEVKEVKEEGKMLPTWQQYGNFDS